MPLSFIILYNGVPHVRTSLLTPSLTIPFKDKKLLRGTYPQIVLLEMETRKLITLVFKVMLNRFEIDVLYISVKFAGGKK